VRNLPIYTTKPGGLYRAMEVAAVARAGGLICNVNGSIETGIGNLANLQLAPAAPAVVLSCVVPVSTPAEGQSWADYITNMFEFEFPTRTSLPVPLRAGGPSHKT
jgi:muconate cycloisomerase